MSSDKPQRGNTYRSVTPKMVRTEDNTPALEQELKHLNTYVVPTNCDFDKTFEDAIFNKESNDFVTKFFYPEGSDDVIGWMNADEVEKLVNSVIKKEDLIIER